MSDVQSERAPSHSPIRSRTKAAKRPIRRVSVACVACRDRKVKCDGNSGQRDLPCSQCKQVDRQCVFDLNDHRKRASSKAYIQHLQDRIAALERNQRSIHPTIHEDGTIQESSQGCVDTSVRDRVGLSNSDTTSRSAPSADEMVFEDCANMTQDDTPLTPSISNDQAVDRDFEMLLPKRPRTTSYQGSQSGVPSWNVEARNHMINQLCAAMGQLSADETGQLCYLATSSNMHVTSFLPPASPQPSDPVSQESEDLADSKDIQQHLLDLFFTYHDPLLQVLQKEPFMSDYLVGLKSQYYSQFLLYSVLLRAMRLSSNPLVRGLDKVYLKRAKQELIAELENPTVATVQALCVFADYRGGLGDDRACLLYPGIAFRMLYDFGLNHDSSDLTSMGYLSERDLQTRHNTFWGCYIYDKFHSIYLGRPSSLKLVDVTVPRPSSEASDFQFQILGAWSELCTIWSDVIDMINGPLHLLESQSTMFRLSITGDRLLQWFKNLPVELKWKPHEKNLPPPGVCALHMQFFTTIILLHRPFAAYTPPSPSLGIHVQKQLTGFTPALSRKACNQNAERISKLLLAYREQYGIEKTFSSMLHMIFTAATIWISQISTDADNNGTEKPKKWLAVCLEAFDDLTPSFYIAGRVRKVLISFLEACGYSDLAPAPKNQLGTAKPRSDQPQQEAQGSQHQEPTTTHNVPPHEGFQDPSAIIGNDAHRENAIIRDTIAEGNDFIGLSQANTSSMNYAMPPPSYGLFEGFDGFFNMRAQMDLSVFHDFDESNMFRTPDLEMNSLFA